MSDTFSLAPNKHPGKCFYCAKRVRSRDGACWRDGTSGGMFVVGHTECVANAVASGRAPCVVQGKTLSAESRSAAGLAPHVRELSPAWVVREVRALLKTVTVADDAAKLDDVVGKLRAIVGACPVGAESEGVPF